MPSQEVLYFLMRKFVAMSVRKSDPSRLLWVQLVCFVGTPGRNPFRRIQSHQQPRSLAGSVSAADVVVGTLWMSIGQPAENHCVTIAEPKPRGWNLNVVDAPLCMSSPQSIVTLVISNAHRA